MNVTSANSAVRDLNVDVCLFPRLDFGEFLPDHFALGGVFVQTHPSFEFVVGCCCHSGGGGGSSILVLVVGNGLSCLFLFLFLFPSVFLLSPIYLVSFSLYISQFKFKCSIKYQKRWVGMANT